MTTNDPPDKDKDKATQSVPPPKDQNPPDSWMKDARAQYMQSVQQVQSAEAKLTPAKRADIDRIRSAYGDHGQRTPPLTPQTSKPDGGGSSPHRARNPGDK